VTSPKTQHFICHTLFQLSQRSDLMPTSGTVNLRVVSMILQQIETVFAAFGAVEFYSHGPADYGKHGPRNTQRPATTSPETTALDVGSAFTGCVKDTIPSFLVSVNLWPKRPLSTHSRH
jgi:hypothetical protein